VPDHHNGEPEFIELPPPPSRTWNWWPIAATLAASALYVMFFSGNTIKPSAKPSPPGWEELSECAFVTSLDGTKELDLFDDQLAVFYEESKNDRGKGRMVEGTWAFDQSAKKYEVTIDGATTIYSIMTPERTAICMLVKGDPAAADLTASWFSIQEDNDSGDYVDPHDH
jgi:hypothetical protein